MRNRLRRLPRLPLLAALALVGATVGCAAAPTLRQPMRAIWVTRGDYRSADDVKQIVKNCADTGFNTVLFQVRGNGTAFYNANVEPWADELGGQDPGFDPLRLAIDEAHARDVDLHAWVNVMPAWRGTKPPADPNQLYNARPEWFWYDQNGKRQELSSFYVSLNPCLPEVRDYLVDVFEDIAARYDIDGLHLDYMRFPNEPPATPRGSGLDYPRDARTLELFKQATGKTPEQDNAAWDAWRTQQVSQLVADIRAMLRRTRPDAVLTSAVGSVRARALSHHQDAEAWMRAGDVDAVILMNYTDSTDEFSARIDPWLAIESRAAVVPGPWFGRHPGKSTTEAASVVREQIDAALSKTGDFCLFAYSSLFDSREEGDLAKQNEPQKTMRAERRAILVPHIQSLAR